MDIIKDLWEYVSSAGKKEEPAQSAQTATPEPDYGAEYDSHFSNTDNQTAGAAQTTANQTTPKYDWYDESKPYGRVKDTAGKYTGEYTFSHSARNLQEQLNQIARSRGEKEIAVDGYYGPETAAAVAKYLGGDASAATAAAAAAGAGSTAGTSTTTSAGNGAQALADTSTGKFTSPVDKGHNGAYTDTGGGIEPRTPPANPPAESAGGTVTSPSRPAAPAPAAGSGGGGKVVDLAPFWESIGIGGNKSATGEGGYSFNSPAGNTDYESYKAGGMDAATFKKRSGMTPEEWQRKLDQAAGARAALIDMEQTSTGSGERAGNFAGVTNEQLGRENPVGFSGALGDLWDNGIKPGAEAAWNSDLGKDIRALGQSTIDQLGISLGGNNAAPLYSADNPSDFERRLADGLNNRVPIEVLAQQALDRGQMDYYQFLLSKMNAGRAQEFSDAYNQYAAPASAYDQPAVTSPSDGEVPKTRWSRNLDNALDNYGLFGSMSLAAGTPAPQPINMDYAGEERKDAYSPGQNVGTPYADLQMEAERAEDRLRWQTDHSVGQAEAPENAFNRWLAQDMANTPGYRTIINGGESELTADYDRMRRIAHAARISGGEMGERYAEWIESRQAGNLQPSVSGMGQGSPEYSDAFIRQQNTLDAYSPNASYYTPPSASQTFDQAHQLGQTTTPETAYSQWLRDDMALGKSMDQIIFEAMQAGLAGSNNAANYYNWITANLRGYH